MQCGILNPMLSIDDVDNYGYEKDLTLELSYESYNSSTSSQKGFQRSSHIISLSDPNETEYDYYEHSILSQKELASLAFHGIRLQNRITWRATADLTEFVRNIAKQEISDYRTVRKLLAARTGIHEVLYDCCLNSCMSFAMYPHLEKCDYCSHLRWKEGTKKPFLQHGVIPLKHRLILWMADSERSAELLQYRRNTLDRSANETVSDYWNSNLYKDTHKKGMFKSITDSGFVLAIDGVQGFKQRAQFSITPFGFKCVNLPPDIRSKCSNILVGGFIPGPKAPKVKMQ